MVARSSSSGTATRSTQSKAAHLLRAPTARASSRPSSPRCVVIGMVPVLALLGLYGQGSSTQSIAVAFLLHAVSEHHAKPT